MRAILSQAISIGPITVPGWLLLYLIGLAVAAAAARFLRAVDADDRRRVADLVLNAGTIWLLAWKLTPILLRPAVTIRDPLSVLSTPGGTIGTVIGLALALASIAANVIRKPPERRVYLQLGASVVSGAMAFLLGIAVLGIALSASGDRDRPAPDFAAEDLNGNELTLEQYRGRTVILNFWATWCPPCRGEIPDLVDFEEGDNVVLLSVNQTFSEPGIGAVADFSREFGIDYPVLLDRTGIISASYGVRGIPTTFVIGPDGRIQERAFGAVSRSWLSRWED